MHNLRPEASHQSLDQLRRPATQYAWPRVLFRRGPLVVQKEGINDDQLGSWWIWRLSTWYVLVFGDFNGLHHAIPTNAYFDWKGECWTLMNHGIWGSYYFQTNSCFQCSKLSNTNGERWKSGGPSQIKVGRSSEACIITASPDAFVTFLMCQLIVWLAHLPAKAPGEWHFQVVRSWAKVFHLLASLLDGLPGKGFMPSISWNHFQGPTMSDCCIDPCATPTAHCLWRCQWPQCALLRGRAFQSSRSRPPRTSGDHWQPAIRKARMDSKWTAAYCLVGIAVFMYIILLMHIICAITWKC